MHVGGVRSALFDWLMAKSTGGQFILRIEDTDQKRETPGAVDHIIETLKWLNLDWDGEIITQSQRLDIYKEWAQKLYEQGKAYADPYSPDEVQAFREKAQKDKKPFLYRNHRPENPPKWDGTQPLRLKSDPKSYKWHDQVLGDLSTGPEVIDDFVLIKSDGYPTYNFCHIVDDELLGITHVIRGQEFLASVPNYLNLYEALETKPPTFATVPWIMAPEGNKKLSKRDGAKDVMAYAKEGYLPEAILSFLATLGWNDGSTQEVFTVDELIEKFSLDRVQKSGARFDERRLLWANGHFIRELPLDELYKKVENYWSEAAKNSDEVYKKQVLGLVQERLKFFSELPELTEFFFQDLPIDLSLITEHKKLKKYDRADLRNLLDISKTTLENTDFSSPEAIQESLNQLLEKTGEKPVIVFSLIRIATTWSPASPGLAETLHLLGKDRAMTRIDTSLQTLAS